MTVTVIQLDSSNLVPPPPGHCPECAIKHDADQPHNRDSIFYQMKFKMDKGRDPTWHDAVEHCSEEVKSHWIATLKSMNVI
jgi:hypothetical protein